MASRPAALGYFNGNWLPLEQIAISPLDRGFLFADGVYEVVPVYAGTAFRLGAHLDRLQQSMAAIELQGAPQRSSLADAVLGLAGRNELTEAAVYLQVTRGAYSMRDHAFPAQSHPTVFGMCTPLEPVAESVLSRGVAAVTRPDLRWQRCAVKSVSLLPNILARQDAAKQGALEAILVRDGYVTEAAASNVFAVIDGELVTPPLDDGILAGITRCAVLELARSNGIAVQERPLPIGALRQASEVWLTSSTREISPVTRVDGIEVGKGRPGPGWRRVRALYQALKSYRGSPP